MVSFWLYVFPESKVTTGCIDPLVSKSGAVILNSKVSVSPLLLALKSIFCGEIIHPDGVLSSTVPLDCYPKLRTVTVTVLLFLFLRIRTSS